MGDEVQKLETVVVPFCKHKSSVSDAIFEAYSGSTIAGQLFRSDSRKILQFSIEENALKKIALRGLADTIAYNELNKWSYFIPSWQADRFLEGLKVIEGGLQ